jgi:D-alanyl-D-alanine carboxypeptidase
MEKFKNKKEKISQIVLTIIIVIIAAIATYIALINIKPNNNTGNKQSSMNTSASKIESSSLTVSHQSETSVSSKSLSVSSASSSSHSPSSKKATSSQTTSSYQVPTSDDGNWQLILVNSEFWIPENFTVQLAPVQGTYNVDKRISTIAKKMISDAKSDGVSLLVCSAYRSIESQTTLYNNKVKYYTGQGYTTANAQATAATIVAKPRTSEHQTGLAMDIVTYLHQELDEEFAETDGGKWLQANAYKYGCILRYPENKQQKTKITFEPWHYRYVGITAAKIIKDNNLCLEEYLGR